MPRIRRLLTLAALALLLPLLAACSGEPDAGPDLADSPLIGAWENAAGTRVEFRADGTYERSSGETGRWRPLEPGQIELQNDGGPVQARARTGYSVTDGVLELELTGERFEAVGEQPATNG